MGKRPKVWGKRIDETWEGGRDGGDNELRKVE